VISTSPTPSGDLADAVQFARIAYTGRTSESGRPAIEHPLRVMSALAAVDAKIVAVLHDTLTNSVATMVDLRALLPNRLLMAVIALGHADNEPEGISFQFILADPIALTVKLACLADRTNPARLAELDPFTRRQREAAGAAAARALGTTLPDVLANWKPGVPLA
jgi:(p)ppGpp synthase/HD superfamily hydrolase